MKMKKGFTLLELMVVIIIIGILASLGIPAYLKTVEKARTSEAKAVISQIRSGLESYYATNGTYVGAVLEDLDIEADIVSGTCNPNYYYQYTLSNLGPSSYFITATRCIADGKPPQGNSAYQIILPSGGNWSGTAGYY